MAGVDRRRRRLRAVRHQPDVALVGGRQVPDAREVSFTASDGVRVYADTYIAHRRAAPFIILFHQGGGDARGEYGPIIPWLIDSGFNVMAVDQRLGGDRFGGTNRTQAGTGDQEYSYCEAYPDVEAALRYVKESFDAEPVVWGSSYSATLAMRLAAEHPGDVAAVLAFSPAGGEPMKGCEPGDYLDELSVPLLIFRPAKEMELPHVREQAEAFRRHGIEVFVPQFGVHGSSMLVPERVEGPVEEARARVLKFLRGISGN